MSNQQHREDVEDLQRQIDDNQRCIDAERESDNPDESYIGNYERLNRDLRFRLSVAEG